MSHDHARMAEAFSVQHTPAGPHDPWVDADGTLHRFAPDLGKVQHEPVRWHVHLAVKHYEGDWKRELLLGLPTPKPYSIIETEDNLLTTAGATSLWNGLSTAGLATPFSTTNAMIAVGDTNTAPATGNTDMAAAAGSTQNTGDISAATNASPIVLTVPSWTVQPTAGQTVVVAGVVGNTNANGTFEVSASSATTLTLLNSTGNGAFSTSAGSTVKIINKYRQQANGAGSAVVTTNSIVYVAVFGTTNANHAWNEWGITTGAAATNKQASPPPTLLNRAVPALGTKTSASTTTATATLSLA